MRQRRRSPLPVWTGSGWQSTTYIQNRDVDHGPGPVGAMPKRAMNVQASPVALVAARHWYRATDR